MKNTSSEKIWTIIAIIIVFVAGLVILIDRNNKLKSYSTFLGNQLLETEKALFVYQNDLTRLEQDNLDLNNVLENREDKIKRLGGELDNLESENDELEKLTTIDQELLQKYSKVFFLNEHYSPPKLDNLVSKHVFSTTRREELSTEVIPFLENLLDEAKDDDVNLLIASAHRSFERQQELKSGYSFVYGSGANQFSADQGYSEHQLGTTVDFTTKELAGLYISFEDTPEFKWLEKNAYKYGFVLSYPRGNSYYQYEPWHWRFVGVSLARALDRDGAYFYDWDQRKIDSYLIKIFD